MSHFAHNPMQYMLTVWVGPSNPYTNGYNGYKACDTFTYKCICLCESWPLWKICICLTNSEPENKKKPPDVYKTPKSIRIVSNLLFRLCIASNPREKNPRILFNSFGKCIEKIPIYSCEIYVKHLRIIFSKI